MTVRAAVPSDLLVHLRRARDLADRHYAEPPDLLTLANAAGVSKYLVGVSPSAYQARYARTGTPRIPGCYVFMHGLSDRAISEMPGDGTRI